MANHPRNQHYVPQLLLRTFTGEQDRLFVFDKQTEMTFTTTTRNVAAEAAFYDFQGHSLEPIMGNIEDAASDVIGSILRHESLAHLTVEDRVTLALFAAVQKVRVKDVRHRIKSVNVNVRKELARRGIDPADVFPELDDAGVKRRALGYIGDAGELAKSIGKKAWLLQKAPEGCVFYISDNPVTLHNLVERLGRGNLGFNSPGIEIYLPISQRFSICFLCSQTHQQICRSLQETTEYENKFGGFPADVMPMKALAEAVATGNPDSLIPENVTHLNSLQVLYSSRFVYSPSDDFDLVRSMISENPRLKHPPEIVVQ